jgi:hypothetical protein
MLDAHYTTDPWYSACLGEVAIRRSCVYMLHFF